MLPRERTIWRKRSPLARVKPAMIFEPLEGIVVEHLAPEIRVITGVVAVAPDVQEIAGAVARRHVSKREMGLLESLRLERIRFFQRRAGRERVPLHIEFCRRQQFGQVVALVEGFRLLDLGGEFRRHRRAASCSFSRNC